MFCPKCGGEVPDGSAFCRTCGSALPSDTKKEKTEPSRPKEESHLPSENPTDAGTRRKAVPKAALAGAALVAALAVGGVALFNSGLLDGLGQPSPPSTEGQEAPAGTAELPQEAADAMDDAKEIAYTMADALPASDATADIDGKTAGEKIEGDGDPVERLEADQAVIDSALDGTDGGTRAKLEAASAAIDGIKEVYAFQADMEAWLEGVSSQSEGNTLDNIAFSYNNLESLRELMGSESVPQRITSVAGRFGQVILPLSAALATTYNRASSGVLSVFDEMTFEEVVDYSSTLDERYSQALIDTWKRCYATAGDILGGESAAPEFDCELTSEIYPNLYPSDGSVANIGITIGDARKSVIIEAEVDGFTQRFEQRYDLEAGYTYLMIKPAPLSEMPDLTDSRETQLDLKITDAETGEVYVQKSEPVALHSIYDANWYTSDFGDAARFNILSWLRPESEVVQSVNRAALDYLEQNFGFTSMPGYQNGYGLGEAETVAVQVAAVQSALSNYGLRYKMDSYSFTAGQHVLTPDQVVASKSGLCVETSLLMASCLQSLGMHAILAFPPGHAQVFVETWAGSGSYLLVETTALPYQGPTLTEEGRIGLDSLLPLTVGSDTLDNYLAFQGCDLEDLYVVDCDLRAPMGMQGLEHA